MLRIRKSCFFLFVFLVQPSLLLATSDVAVRQIVQLAEYIGVDYEEAVHDRTIIDDGEYAEMLEFSALILEQVPQIDGPNTSSLEDIALKLSVAIDQKDEPEVIRSLVNRLKSPLISTLPTIEIPQKLLPQEDTVHLFIEQCSSCHGSGGRGDGVLAPNLNPKPTDFSDLDRANNRSLLGLHDVIKEGIAGTSMAAFNLTENQIWSLAFYVGGIAFEKSGTPAEDARVSGVSLSSWVTMSPTQLLGQDSILDVRFIGALRADPFSLFVELDPIQTARLHLSISKQAYANGDHARALRYALSAYLDGFELSEAMIDSKDSELRRRLETQFMDYRELVTVSNKHNSVLVAYENILKELDSAEKLLSEAISNEALFGISLLILLREGFEAMLIVTALIVLLKKTGRSDSLSYVYYGLFAALAAGVASWIAAEHFISVSGENREILEGSAALIAALLLFYVGFWMHSKSHAERWQDYIRTTIDDNLSKGTLWGLTGLTFFSVYREMFETILFYQSLLIQSNEDQHSFVLGGFLAAIVLLVGGYFMLMKNSTRIPIGSFFRTTTFLLLGLSVVMMGKAILALQEAAVVQRSSLPIDIEVSWLGVHSTWEGISAQIFVLLVATLLVLKAGSTQNAR